MTRTRLTAGLALTGLVIGLGTLALTGTDAATAQTVVAPPEPQVIAPDADAPTDNTRSEAASETPTISSASPTPASTTSPTTTLLPADLAGSNPFLGLSSVGRFDDLLEAIRRDPTAHHEADQLGLVEDLQRYRRNQADLLQQKTEAFHDALARVESESRDDDLEKAMKSAIEAHSLADEPDVLLHDPLMESVIAKTEIAAKQAELARDWVEASVLYSRLNLLFEKDRHYLPDVERIGRHIRVLNVYNPDYLRVKLRERDERHGKAISPVDADPDPDDWKTRLSGVKRDMVRRVIEQAASSHIEHRGYQQLVAGAIESLMVLLDTEGLTPVFPALGDAQPVGDLRAELVRLAGEVEQAGDSLSKLRAASILDRVFAANQRTVDLPEAVVAYEMTDGALSTLDDFSSMYWPEDVDHLRRSTHGAFYGVGVQIQRLDHQLVVVSPLPGTPAYAAGIKAGDVIATVNHKDTSPWTLNKAVREITGPEGTKVNLGIRREGHDDLLRFAVERKRIAIESIKGWKHSGDAGWDYWLDKDSGIGYIRLTQFIPQTYDDLNAAIATLQKEGTLTGVILDLRFNPGGLLNSAIDTADRFVDDGPLLFTVDGDRKQNNRWDAHRRGTLNHLDLVILINQGSASASEIVSGSLQDHGRAFIVGTRSYGKGSVQNVFWHPSARRPKWGLKITTEYYQLPSGKIIHRTDDSTTWGIQPDLVVEVPDQTVAWAVELRQEIDVIRENAGDVHIRKSNPAVTLAGLEPVAPRDDAAKDMVTVPGVTPAALLELGLDPQLEAAMLVLKARELSRDIVIARAAEPDADTDTP